METRVETGKKTSTCSLQDTRAALDQPSEHQWNCEGVLYMIENDVLVPLSSFKSLILGDTAAQSVKELIFPQVSYVVAPNYLDAFVLNSITLLSAQGYTGVRVLLTTDVGKVNAKTTTLTLILQ